VLITVTYIAIAVGLEMVLGFGIALLLNSPLKGGTFFKSMILIPMFIPPIVAGTMWKFMFNAQFGIINYLVSRIGITPQDWLSRPLTALGSVIFVDIWQWTPYVALLLLAGLNSLPPEPFEAALVDGAKGWQILRRVTIPLLRPFLGIALILRVIQAYKVFDTIYILTRGGPGTSTQVLSMSIYLTAFQYFQIGEAAALSYLVLIGAIVLTTIFINRFMRAPKRREA